MRAIIKGPEPRSLTVHRKKKHSNYDNYREKAELRRTLVTEQRGLCCYCMARIHSEPTKMKIEHWRCQRYYQERQLEYRNLLAACLGGEGQPQRLQHCDTSKGDRFLEWNPADPAHHIETRISYGLDGSVHGDEAKFDEHINDVLNLNLPILRNNRKGLLDAVLLWWKKEKARIGGPVTRDRVIREIDKHSPSEGQLGHYSQVTVWWLNQCLEGMPA